MLTGEPVLVAGAAKLLEDSVRSNKQTMANLYQTGVFCFALAYCGSNLLEIAKLFHVSLLPVLAAVDAQSCILSYWTSHGALCIWI